MISYRENPLYPNWAEPIDEKEKIAEIFEQAFSDPDLLKVSNLAIDYVEYYKKENRIGLWRIIDEVAPLSNAELVYFCKEIVTWTSSQYEANMILDSFCNRIGW